MKFGLLGDRFFLLPACRKQLLRGHKVTNGSVPIKGQPDSQKRGRRLTTRTASIPRGSAPTHPWTGTWGPRHSLPGHGRPKRGLPPPPDGSVNGLRDISLTFFLLSRNGALPPAWGKGGPCFRRDMGAGNPPPTHAWAVGTTSIKMAAVPPHTSSALLPGPRQITPWYPFPADRSSSVRRRCSMHGLEMRPLTSSRESPAGSNMGLSSLGVMTSRSFGRPRRLLRHSTALARLRGVLLLSQTRL
jgi:hypothetical protein